MLSLISQSCPTLCDPMDCNPPGSSVHGDSPGKNTGVGSHALLQGIFPTQRSNPGLPHCRQILYRLSHQGSPRILEWVAYPFSRGSFWSRNPTGVSSIAGRFFTSWATREAHLLHILPFNFYYAKNTNYGKKTVIQLLDPPTTPKTWHSLIKKPAVPVHGSVYPTPRAWPALDSQSVRLHSKICESLFSNSALAFF